MGCIHCCIEIVGVGCFGGLEFHQRVIRVRRSIYTIMPQMKDNHCLSCQCICSSTRSARVNIRDVQIVISANLPQLAGSGAGTGTNKVQIL